MIMRTLRFNFPVKGSCRFFSWHAVMSYTNLRLILNLLSLIYNSTFMHTKLVEKNYQNHNNKNIFYIDSRFVTSLMWILWGNSLCYSRWCPGNKIYGDLTNLEVNLKNALIVVVTLFSMNLAVIRLGDPTDFIINIGSIQKHDFSYISRKILYMVILIMNKVIGDLTNVQKI